MDRLIWSPDEKVVATKKSHRLVKPEGFWILGHLDLANHVICLVLFHVT